MRFPEMYKVVPVMSDLAMGSTPTKSDSINMSKFHRATYIIMIGNTLAGADATLTVWSGATDAAVTSQIYFKYAFSGGAGLSATADVLAADSYVNTLLIAHATKDCFMLIVEVDVADMDMANQEEWLTLSFADAGTTGEISAVAILEPRYSQACSVTALA